MKAIRIIIMLTVLAGLICGGMWLYGYRQGKALLPSDHELTYLEAERGFYYQLQIGNPIVAAGFEAGLRTDDDYLGYALQISFQRFKYYAEKFPTL